jgi:hypothetical protein
MRAARRVKTLSEETRQNCTDALQWPERRRDARRFRSHKLLDPIRDGASKLLNLVLVLHEPWIVRHATPPCCGHMQFVGICNRKLRFKSRSFTSSSRCASKAKWTDIFCMPSGLFAAADHNCKRYRNELFSRRPLSSRKRPYSGRLGLAALCQ